MPEDPSFEETPSPCIDGGFFLRVCEWRSGGDVMKSLLLLPVTATEDELRTRNERVYAECRAWMEDRRREELAEAERRLQEQLAREAAEAEAEDDPAPLPAASPNAAASLRPATAKLATGAAEAASERVQLECAHLDAQPLLERDFDEVAAIREGPLGHLHVPVYAWDEPLKLIELAGSTPDRDVHRRGKDLYQRIRTSHTSQVRPVGYPLASYEWVLEDLERLEREMPQFAEVVGSVRSNLMPSYARKQPMRLPPMLVLGDPGVGKTHFTMALAGALRLPVHRHCFDSGITQDALTGSDKHWGNTSTGLMFEALVLGSSASPVVLLDEIDKAGKAGRPDPVTPLHSLLEPVSARAITDISVNFTFDASHVVWIATANKSEGVPATICSRFREFVIEAPQGEAAIRAAQAVARTVHARLGPELFEPPDKRIVVAVAHLPVRQQIQALEEAFSSALASNSRTVRLHHLPRSVLQDLQIDIAPQAKDDSEPPQGGYLH
jgi:ATP-dependent Lon protease